MIYGLIQLIYVTVFAILFEKMGFRWKWFLPLAGAFIAATLLISGKALLGFTASTGPEDRMPLLSTPMYIIFCPIHAFITVHVMKAIPKNSPRFEQVFVKVLIYWGAAMAAGAVLTVFIMLGAMAYFLVKNYLAPINFSLLW